MKKIIFNRLIDKDLKRMLNSTGCVLVKGPKFVGKSTTCMQFAKSKTELKEIKTINLAKADPYTALKGENPHLIDEWQKVPELWDIIRDDLDKDYQFGKYIITGSTTPVNPKAIQHSGAGRIASLIMRPLSLYESQESSGIVSISSLFKNNNIETIYKNNISIIDIAHMMCRGGWPISVLADKQNGIQVTLNYYNSLFELENEGDEYAQFLSGKDINLIKLIVKEYARNISTKAKKSLFINDIIKSGARLSLNEDTFDTYANVLKKLFIVYELPTWNVNLRSSVQIIQTPSHHFYDTSIALASLGIRPNDLLNDLNSFGLFFEDFALRDLQIYSQSLGATIKHYRDSNGLEVDAIIELENGNYGAIEIKIASEENINTAIKSLLRFSNYMEKHNNKKPEFMMVLTSHGACYKSKEDVLVVPINCLKD